jgi:hypothetical protein
MLCQVLLHQEYLDLLKATNALRRTRNDMIQQQQQQHLDKTVW